MIKIIKNDLGYLSFNSIYGVETVLIYFWYPTLRINWLARGTNFVTDNPPYPDLSAPWQYHDFDHDTWDEIPF